ncbi:hypothetical protein, partial [Lacticaseibacillus sp. GG6-2]
SFWFRRLEHSMGSFVGVLLICHFKKGLHSRRWISPTPESVDPVFLIIIAGVAALRPSVAQHADVRLDKQRMTYDGRMLKNKFDGQGTLKFKNGDRYQGRFKAGRFDGAGTFTSHRGWQYEGHFNAGSAIGQGILIKGNHTYKGTVSGGVFKREKVSQN